MAASLAPPQSPGRQPAIPAVHGYRRRAKPAPVLRPRCIGAGRLVSGRFHLADDSAAPALGPLGSGDATKTLNATDAVGVVKAPR